MRTIGIKLADGTFYPILEEGEPKRRELEVTTAKDNQDEVRIDLYRSDDESGTNAEYVDTLTVPNLNPHPNGEPSLRLSISLDENGELSAEIVDGETGAKRDTKVSLPDFDAPAEESADASEEEPTVAPENEDFSLPDFDVPVEESAEKSLDSLDLPDFDAIDSSSENSEVDNAVDSFDSFDLPDFDTGGENQAADSAVDSFDSFDLPDFDAPPKASSSGATKDDPFNSMDFSDLYDKDRTATAEFGEEDDMEEEKRSAAPIIVVIIVILLCLLAAAALLFIFPSRFNVLKKTESSISMPTFITNLFGKKENGAESEKTSDENTESTSLSALDQKIDGQISSAPLDEKRPESSLDGENVAALSASDSDSQKTQKEEPISSKPHVSGEQEQKTAAESSEKIEPKTEEKPAELEVAKKIEPSNEQGDTVDKIVIEPDASSVVPSSVSAPSAEEDKIVIAPDASKVVPVAKPELTTKKDAIKHHVKWGDTLWDISETYYKNPWRYPVIADYNNIPNPDFIVAGKDLLVPSE